MPGFSLILQPVECSPVADVCRTVAYTAEQLGVTLGRVSCELGERRYRAVLYGQDAHVRELGTVLSTGFPDVKVTLAAIADTLDPPPPALGRNPTVD